MTPPIGLDLGVADRSRLWRALINGIDAYLNEVVELGAAGEQDRASVAELLAQFDFDRPLPPEQALDLVLRGLREQQQHARHPRNFGLFDSAPTTMGIVGDALAATFNACLATRDGSPFGVGAEDKLVKAFGVRFGYSADEVDGVITSGGSESNFSALLLAIRHRFPDVADRGLVGMTRRPIVYVSAEAHPSVPRAVRLAGLGAKSICTVPTDDTLRMNLTALRDLIMADLRAGLTPLAIAVTAGTTASGVIDPLDGAADIAAEYGVWLHADAAWGGAAALLPELGSTFHGLRRADSLTFDPHKWMSVPLGVGMLLTRHEGLLERTFGLTQTFLDSSAAELGTEPFARSLRWSRGFAGLKVLLSIAVVGWSGYQESLRQQVVLGEQLRARLAGSGWLIVNDTPLPVICFVPAELTEQAPERLRLLAKMVCATGQARIFVVKIGSRYTLRACITNHATTAADVDVLVEVLNDAAQRLRIDQVGRPSIGDIAVNSGTGQPCAERGSAAGWRPR